MLKIKHLNTKNTTFSYLVKEKLFNYILYFNILRLATTWRSGSTFLGDLLNHYPGSFYYFEPLHYIYKHLDAKLPLDK